MSVHGGPARAASKTGKELIKKGNRLATAGHGNGTSWYQRGRMSGGLPNIHYEWMRPGSYTRRTVEKKRNPYVDLEAGNYIYYRDVKDPPEAIAAERERMGAKGSDNSLDLYNEYKIVPDLYPEGFQWKHKLNSEYQQWRSNTWYTPQLIPPEHRGRLLCNFWVNIAEFDMKVVKFSPKDARQWVYCAAYIGTGKGMAGWGRAVAPSTNEAKSEAVKEAFQALQGVDLEFEGPMVPTRVNWEGVRIAISPSHKLTGNWFVADMCAAFGIWKVGVRVQKTETKKKSTTRMVGAFFHAMELLRSVNEVAVARGKIPHSLVYNMYPYLEELRRRKGMMAMSPKGKDGLMMPDRVVDNRLPDHLKKGYYDDTYWKDFFAGNAQQLNEPKIGLRGDQMRQQLFQPVQVVRNPRTGIVEDVPIKTQQGGPGKRRTLHSVLTRMGKSPKDLGSVPIFDTEWDAKLATHAKSTFHLH